MEEALRARLAKLPAEYQPFLDTERDILMFSKSVLEAVRAHINETLPHRVEDVINLDETIEILADYQ